MKNRAPRLDAIGFPWVLRPGRDKVDVKFEDRVQQLAEFHRVNR